MKTVFARLDCWMCQENVGWALLTVSMVLIVVWVCLVH